MDTSKEKHITGLDFLRALAITLVFLYHYRLFDHPDWIDVVSSFGWTGVDLFFVLSGYLIAGQIFKGLQLHTFTLSTFFIKRIFRILPAYWVVLALYYLLPPFREWESLPPVWKLLTFTQNFGLDLREHRTFSHAWSLCIEEQFYLLLPFTVLLLHKVRAGKWALWLLAALFIAGLALRAAGWQHAATLANGNDAFGIIWYKYVYYPTYNRLDGLLAGIIVAAIMQYTTGLKAIVTRYANLLFALGLLLLVVAYLLVSRQTSFPAAIWGFPLIALAYGLWVASATGLRSLFNKVPSRMVSGLATLSYAVYLTHKAAIHMAQSLAARWGLATDSTWVLLISIAASLIASVILHYSIEKPFLKLRTVLLSRQKAA